MFILLIWPYQTNIDVHITQSSIEHLNVFPKYGKPNTIIKHITRDLKCVFFSYGLATNKVTRKTVDVVVSTHRRQEQDESSNVQEAMVEEAVRALHPRSMLGDFGGIFGFWLGPYQNLVDPKKCFWETHKWSPKLIFTWCYMFTIFHLVVWNMNGLCFPSYWECRNPTDEVHHFSEG